MAKAAGVPWVRKEDYAAFLAIMEDADGLPETWEKFAKLTEEFERRAEVDGMLVVRAYIDPETFPDWCAANGYGVNSKGRVAFAGTITAQKSRNQS